MGGAFVTILSQGEVTHVCAGWLWRPRQGCQPWRRCPGDEVCHVLVTAQGGELLQGRQEGGGGLGHLLPPALPSLQPHAAPACQAVGGRVPSGPGTMMLPPPSTGLGTPWVMPRPACASPPPRTRAAGGCSTCQPEVWPLVSWRPQR